MSTKTTTRNGTGFACVACGHTFSGSAACPACGSRAIEFAPAAGPPVAAAPSASEVEAAAASFAFGVATARACGFCV
jgi:uncharacterized OB-fold protein